VRPILAVGSRFVHRHAARIAQGYRAAGVGRLELRVSPLGGENVGPTSLRRVFQALEVFREHHVAVVLGASGTIGFTAVALGLADAFTTGVGYRERYDHKAAMAIQRRLADDDDDQQPFGPSARVYLAAADALIPRQTAASLYANTSIRSRVGCRHGRCSAALDGPLHDPRGHYLHARTAHVVELLDRPSAWRPMGTRDQLVNARDFRRQLWQYLPAGADIPKGRTLDSLIGELDHWLTHRRSA
jgi:hypothetical protein